MTPTGGSVPDVVTGAKPKDSLLPQALQLDGRRAPARPDQHHQVALRIPPTGRDRLCQRRVSAGSAPVVLCLRRWFRDAHRMPVFRPPRAPPLERRPCPERIRPALPLKPHLASGRLCRACLPPRPAGPRAKEPRSLLSEATALLAHDLNNQLALILANIEYLDEYVREHANLNPDINETVATSQAALRHMMTLVRNMTDIARMEDPGLHPAPVGDRRGPSFCAVWCASIARSTSAARSRCRVECPEVLRAEVNPVLVKRIAHNLISNSRRFVDKDGAVRVTAALEVAPDGQVLVLTVSNTGPAISPERHATLFDKYRLNPDGRIARGMGLYFCRLACEAHGGSMSLSRDDEFPTAVHRAHGLWRAPVSRRSRRAQYMFSHAYRVTQTWKNQPSTGLLLLMGCPLLQGRADHVSIVTFAMTPVAARHRAGRHRGQHLEAAARSSASSASTSRRAACSACRSRSPAATIRSTSAST